MSQSELLIKTIAALEGAGIAYMLTGSYASSLQGEPRLTHDIDVVTSISAASAGALVAAFPAPAYYLDEDSVLAAVAARGQFNLLDVAGGEKVDFWVLTDDPFDQSRFARRYVEYFQGQRVFVSSAEDTILMKLRWAQMAGGSEKQMGDAQGVYELQSGVLDLVYIEHWARELGVVDRWERIRARAAGGGS